MMPPPPTPWMERPTRMTVKLSATAATIEPARKKPRLMYIRVLRPNMCEKEPSTGWKTVDVKRNDVPDQNASMAVPPRALAMICQWLANNKRGHSTSNVLEGPLKVK